MKTTPTTATRFDPIQFQPLAQRLKAWRVQRTAGQRIPEELWKAAAQLARVHGLSPTASALKLNYYDLQRRLGSDRTGPQAGPPKPRFVELPPPGPGSCATDPGTMEVLGPSGARLTVRLPKASPKELLPLFQAFLRS